MAYLFKQPGSANWWIGYRTAGLLKRHSTGTDDKSKAQEELARIQSIIETKRAGMLTESVIEALTAKPMSRATLKGEADAWVAECEASTAGGTAARYRGIMETYCRFSKATEDRPLLRDVSTEQLRGYFAHRLKVIGPSTVNVERKILRMFFKRACDLGALKENPILAIKHFRQSGGTKRKPFTKLQLSDLFAASEGEWQFMVLCGFYTGLRIGDCATLLWDEVDFESSVFNRRDKKTDKSLHIPISARLLIWLQSEWENQGRPNSGYIAPVSAAIYEQSGSGALSNQFHKLMSAAKIVSPRSKKHRAEKSGRSAKRQTNPLSFHSLRHSFVSFLKSSGAPQAVAKELAGHSSDVLSDLYTHTPIETLKASIALLPDFTQ